MSNVNPTLFEIEADAVKLRPHEFQRRALNSKARITIVLKGWRGGYTSLAPWWMVQTMQACGPGGRAMHYLCLTPTIRGARGGLMSTMQSVFCDTLQIGTFTQAPIPRIAINKRGEQMLWGHEQREPTEIHFCFAEEPDSFAHYTALAIVADELNQKKFKFESWGVAKARLSTTSGQISEVDGRPKGRILGGSTVYNLNWLQDVWGDWQKAVMCAWKSHNAALKAEPSAQMRAILRADFKKRLREGTLHADLNFIRFDSTKNPAFNPQEFINARAALPDWFFQMRYCARFRRPAGMIFEAWDPGRHIVEPFHIPSHWPREAAIDFGKRNFYATLWAWDEERDRSFLYKSYHDSHLSNQERAAELLKLEPNLSWAVAGQISESSDRAELAAGGLIAVPPLEKSLWFGINAMAAAIKLNKIFVVRGACPGFEEQVRSYSRPVDEQGNVLQDTDPEDKETYHWLDGPRYRSTHRHSGLASTNVPVSGGREQLQVASPSGPVSGGGNVVTSRFGREGMGGYDPLGATTDGLGFLF